MANIHDVAKKAGLAVGTVSRYLNGYHIKEANRKRIDLAIQELGFKRNVLARGLKNRKTGTVGILMPELTEVFATRVVSITENILFSHQYSTIICDYQNSLDMMDEKLNFLIERMVDAIVLIPRHGSLKESTKQRLLDEDIPLIIVDEDLPRIEGDRVFIDNELGSYDATRYLLENNHRKIAIVNGFEHSSVAQARFVGFKRAMEEAGLSPMDEYVRWSDFTTSGGHETTLDLLSLDNPPSAIVLTNYYLTIGAILAIYEMNIRVPSYLSVIGFGYFELSDIARPSLTSIDQPIREMGENTARIVLKRIGDDAHGEKESVILAPKLVINKSVSPR